jgi:hypothetical protein
LYLAGRRLNEVAQGRDDGPCNLHCGVHGGPRRRGERWRFRDNE